MRKGIITVVSENADALLSREAKEASSIVPAKDVSTFSFRDNCYGFQSRESVEGDGFGKR